MGFNSTLSKLTGPIYIVVQTVSKRVIGGYTPKWGVLSESSFLFSFGNSDDLHPHKYPFSSRKYDYDVGSFGGDFTISFPAKPTLRKLGEAVKKCEVSTYWDYYEPQEFPEGLPKNEDISEIEIWTI